MPYAARNRDCSRQADEPRLTVTHWRREGLAAEKSACPGCAPSLPSPPAPTILAFPSGPRLPTRGFTSMAKATSTDCKFKSDVVRACIRSHPTATGTSNRRGSEDPHNTSFALAQKTKFLGGQKRRGRDKEHTRAGTAKALPANGAQTSCDFS